MVPVLVGDDWKAVFLWKALYEAGVFVNVMIHPAVPPAGALLRTSVMATHDRETLDRALEVFADVKRSVRVRAWDAPERRVSRRGLVRSRTRHRAREKRRSKRMSSPCDIAVTESFVLAS